MDKTAYVIEAHAPYGGAYMTYHVARILHIHYGYRVCVVTSSSTPAGLWKRSIVNFSIRSRSIFKYDIEYPCVSLADCERLIRDNDVLISNPSYSSHQLGLRCRGLKIMYAQGFTTFKSLDCFFDHYVAVSGFVQHVLRQTYGISAPVIPAFLADMERLQPPAPWVDSAADWESRPSFSLALNLKGDPVQQMLLLNELRSKLKAKDQTLEASIDWVGALERGRERVPRKQFLERLASVRYLLTLSLTEGLGLIPLEAMALGTVVLGFDGFGGQEYMVPGTNCAVVACPNIDAAAAAMIRVMRDDAFAKQLVNNARQTASSYTYESFSKAWIEQFDTILSAVP